MGEDDSILIVAFDGLDFELIKNFNLENIQQEEFGRIDNQTGIENIKTSELFASFITGENSSAHGVRGVKTWNKDWVPKLESIFDKLPFFDKFNSLRASIYESINSLDVHKIHQTKEYLECTSFFDEIEDSRAMFVPSYNPSPFWQVDNQTHLIDYGYTPKEVAKYWDSREFLHRKKSLLDELDSDIIPPRNLLMCHFHRPDLHQHMYGDKVIERFNKAELKAMYQEMDELAEEIKRKALEKGYERIIFMSDHGLPTKESHNENAFYSCNKPLFQNTPKITDFYDVVMDNYNR